MYIQRAFWTFKLTLRITYILPLNFNNQTYGKIKTPLDLYYLQTTIFQQTLYTNIYLH